MTVQKPKILIVDDIHPVFLQKLQNADMAVDYLPDIRKEAVLAIIPQYSGLVIRSKFQVDTAFMDAATNLVFIARGGAGMDNIDDTYAHKKGITLINAPEGNCDAMAEHMLGMLLGLMNKIAWADQEVRKGQWLREENRGLELGGRTVALVGYGHNGQAMARKLSGFGVTVIAYDKYKHGFSDPYATEASMEEVVRRADVLSLHIPLTRETCGLVDEEYLFHFRKPIFFLNGARGEIVRIPAVLKAIGQGRILGAAFDVLPEEKQPALQDVPWFAELAQNSRVLLTPHVAGWSVESYFKIANILADKVLAFLHRP